MGLSWRWFAWRHRNCGDAVVYMTDWYTSGWMCLDHGKIWSL